MNDFLKHALSYVNKGWPVLPCLPNDKKPATKHGYKDATTDKELVQTWWKQWPTANIAVQTGLSSGLFVLDVDVKNNANGIESLNALTTQYGDLPDTLSATTPSGGLHYIFRLPNVSIKNRVGFLPGLDIRADGGYVLVAPSSIGGSQYTWRNEQSDITEAPEWLINLIVEQAPVDKRHALANGNLDGFGEGERNDGIFRLAASCRNRDLPYEQAKILVLDAANKCTPPLEHKEAIQCLDSAYGRYTPGKIRPLTDLGNAERLIDRYGDSSRYVPEYTTWIHWNDNRWYFDRSSEIYQKAKAVVRGISNEANSSIGQSQKESISRHARQSERRAAIENLVNLASKDSSIVVNAEKLDAAPYTLGVKNGVVDLKIGQLVEAIRDLYVTKHSYASYDKSAGCPEWDKFLLSVMGNDIELVNYLKRAVGYTLTGDTREQSLFILYGTGANGKSTFLDIVQRLLGTYSRSVASETFMARQARNSSGPSEDIARLKGARLAATSETEEGQILAEALVKSMTGEDTLVARLPYAKESLEIKPTFKVWVAANHRPIIRGDDYAIWRRIQLIPFEQKFTAKDQDKNLRAKLELELSGILNWALDGCIEWQKVGLNPPATVLNAIQSYRTEMDLLAEWIESCCVSVPCAYGTVKELYSSYRTWCIQNDVTSLGSRIFGRKLTTKGYAPKKKGGERGYAGIGLRERSELRAVS